MRIKILKPTVIHGRPGVQVGDILEVDAYTAHELTCGGRAVDYHAPVADVPAPVLTREPVIESRDPVIQPTVRRKKTLP